MRLLGWHSTETSCGAIRVSNTPMCHSTRRFGRDSRLKDSQSFHPVETCHVEHACIKEPLSCGRAAGQRQGGRGSKRGQPGRRMGLDSHACVRSLCEMIRYSDEQEQGGCHTPGEQRRRRYLHVHDVFRTVHHKHRESTVIKVAHTRPIDRGVIAPRGARPGSFIPSRSPCTIQTAVGSGGLPGSSHLTGPFSSQVHNLACVRWPWDACRLTSCKYP